MTVDKVDTTNLMTLDKVDKRICIYKHKENDIIRDEIKIH